MKMFLKLSFIILTLTFLGGCFMKNIVPSNTKSLVLVWNDEFDGQVLDTKKWTAIDRASSHNNELQAYLSKNVRIENGNLVITSRKEDYTGKDNFNQSKSLVTRNYTSGIVNTYGKYFFTYGRVEIRAKLPKTQGIWSAHWMLPEDKTWPPEIDIMEMLGHQPNIVYFTNHWGSNWENHESNGSGKVEGPDFSEDYHIFSIEWEEQEIRWYIDNELKFVSTKGVPNKDFYIILNTAVGGNWPKNPDETTVFPQEHLIDYVRVYQKK